MFALEYPGFDPHPLLGSGNLQTIVGNLFGAETRPHGLEQYRVRTDDGDQLVLHDDDPAAPSDRRIAFTIHGLGGCHASRYLQRLSSKLLDRGIHPIRMDQRGCGTGDQLARHMAHAGRAADIALCLQWLADRYPLARITPCAFSLGASVLLKALATQQIPDAVDSAIAVSPPFDLADCCERIPTFYDRHYTRRLWKYWLSHRERLNGADEIRIAKRPSSILEFDRWITAPLNRYDSVEDYYHQSSAGRQLPAISLATIILIADDDPIVPADAYASAALGANMRLLRSTHGGHLGFISRSKAHAGETDRRWMEWRIVDWLSQLDS